jgi:uncharacterized membrane protein YesL
MGRPAVGTGRRPAHRGDAVTTERDPRQEDDSVVAGTGPRARPDWREGLSVAADLALIGIAVTVVCLPVLTAGAAVRTGSVAVRGVVDGERIPSLVDLWRVFRRALVPGAVATVVVLAVAGLLAVDVAVLSSGRVPGGLVVLAATVVLVGALAAFAALTTVRLGRAPEDTWRAASMWAFAAARQAPGAAATTVGVLGLAAVIAVLVPVTAPLLTGFVLFALHVVVRRFIG